MSTKTITVSVMLLGILGWIGWDIYVATNQVSGDTISEITLGASYKWSVIPFAAGIVAGHLWWPSVVMFHKTTRFFLLLAVCVLSLVADIVLFPKMIPVIPLLVGVFAGHYLWPQIKKPENYI